MKHTKKLTLISVLVSIALVIYVIEAQVPVLFPGIKLGLANAVSLTALLIFGWKEALTIMLIRTILGSIFGGSISAFMFSIAGGLLSNVVMILLYKYFKGSMSIAAISVCGAIFHNIGQLFVASIIINDFKVYLYLPVLLTSGVVTGFFIGVVTKLLKERLEHIFK